MSALLIARSEPRADASLPAILARSLPGIAIGAMMPMIATTMSSSISVKPLVLFITRVQKKGGFAPREHPPGIDRLNRYLMATAAFGVGTPAALIAVIVAVCWKMVCASLVPKKRVPRSDERRVAEEGRYGPLADAETVQA